MLAADTRNPLPASTVSQQHRLSTDCYTCTYVDMQMTKTEADDVKRDRVKTYEEPAEALEYEDVKPDMNF